MKICLATVHKNPSFIPLALLYLRAYLVERAGHALSEIDLAEFDQEAAPEVIAARILSTGPAVVGLSCYVWNVRTLMAAARLIRAARPDVLLVLGGPEVGPVAAAVLTANPFVDVVVCSEGELPFAEVVACARDGRTLDEVAGIAYRQADRIIENAEAPLLRDINELPSPHTDAYADRPGRVVCIETQRGCVFRCNFCFYNKDLSVRNRRFDLARVEREILFWLQRDIDELYLMDPVFNLYADRAKAICRLIAAHNPRRIAVHAEVWAEFIDDELAALMREANVSFLEVGLQTTDADVLATVERRLKMQKFLDGIGFLKAHGLAFELQLIYGLPGETVASFHRSLDFAVTLDPPELAVFPLMVLPGTELWRKAEAMGLRFSHEPPYFVESHLSMSPDEVAYGFRLEAALREIGDRKTFRMLCREKGVRPSEVFDAWLEQVPTWPAGAALAERVTWFLDRFCPARGIPADFYQACASVEFGAAPVSLS